MQVRGLVVIGFFVFLLSLIVRLPFVFHPAALHIREAEYLDLARSFAQIGRGRSSLTWHLLGATCGEQWSETSHPLLLPLASGGVLSLASRFHPAPEKMLAYTDSWLIARTFNAVIGSLAVAIWFSAAVALTDSVVWALLFALLLATNEALVQNSAMHMPEQWLLLLTGLTIWCWKQGQAWVAPLVIAALGFALLVGTAISAGELSIAFSLATYLPLPFWWLFGVVAWLSDDRRSVRLFGGLIAISGFLVLTDFIGLTNWLWSFFVALPFNLSLLLWRRFVGWERAGALWASIGGAVASVAFHARPEGLLLGLVLPVALPNRHLRWIGFVSWLLGCVWGVLPFWYAWRSLPMVTWWLNFCVLDFPVDSWRLYGQALPHFAEFITAHWDDIMGRVVQKTQTLAYHLAYALGLLWIVVPLMFGLKQVDAEWKGKAVANALPLGGLLFFSAHALTWSVPAEARLILVPLVFFALWLFRLWHRWLQMRQCARRPVALFVAAVSYAFIVNGWGLMRAWRTEPAWHPEALKVATAMTNAMVEPDPMEATKTGCGVVSNMPWLISLHARRLLTLMPLLDTPHKWDAFVREHNPAAFVFLLRGHTPQEAIGDEPRAKAWLIWQRGNLQLRRQWAERMSLVDWRLFRNRNGVNLVVMTIPKEVDRTLSHRSK